MAPGIALLWAEKARPSPPPGLSPWCQVGAEAENAVGMIGMIAQRLSVNCQHRPQQAFPQGEMGEGHPMPVTLTEETTTIWMPG